MRRFLSSIALVVGLVGPARAQPRPLNEVAKAEMDRGLERLAARDFAAAITAFDAGYAIDPDPRFLYDKAQAQRLGGDCRSALDSYKAFLASDPPKAQAEVAQLNITRCEQVIAASHTTPIEVVEPKHEQVETVEPPRPVDVPKPPPSQPWWRDNVGLGLLGTGMISVGVSIGFVLSARASADETATESNLQDWLSSRDAWQRDQIVAGITAGVGAALLLGAGFRFWSASGDHVVVTPAPAPGGAVMMLGGRW